MHEEDLPLMSVRDAGLLILTPLFGTEKDIKKRFNQMHICHEKRQQSIGWWYMLDKEYTENFKVVM